VSERALRAATAVLALAGTTVSAYVLAARATGSTLICSTGGCETVQSSPYAEVLGVPVALLALVGFLAMAAFAAGRGEAARLGAAVTALTAFAFSGYLLWAQLARIDAVCDWCLVTDALVAGLAVLALARLQVGFTGAGRPAAFPQQDR
jgi:uncharacterized membrane protein